MKKGFTLAEVIVTLGIIGVTVAIVLPIINSVRPNEELVMLKKAYYKLTNNVNDLISDEDLYPEVNNTAFSHLSNTSRVSFRNQDYGADIPENAGPNELAAAEAAGQAKFCGLLAAKMGSTCVNGTFTDRDGMVWTVPNTDFNRGQQAPGSVQITVDVNGPDRGRNCTDARIRPIRAAACAEPDTFNLTVNRFGRVDFANTSLFGPLYIAEKDNTKKAGDFGVKQSVPGPVIGPNRPPVINERPLNGVPIDANPRGR